MPKLLMRGPLIAAGLVLSIIGAAALLRTALVAAPLTRPPPLASISNTARAVDRSTMPDIERFQARDGTGLAYRHYPARGAAVGRVAVLVHGSSGSSTSIHALADALAARGVETFAVDIRGHGASGARGDLGYVGQLEDDLVDFVAVVRKNSPDAPLTLLGHSAGGGFALRVAASPIQNLFARTVLLAPYLGSNAPTNTERLRRNFGNHPDFRADLAAATRPLTIISGADDELMLADKYVEAVRGVKVPVNVKLIEGVNHMGIVSNPAAISVIADDVATTGLSS
jgi:pimeloyl-ACP methyl ester carboxylesterase